MTLDEVIAHERKLVVRYKKDVQTLKNAEVDIPHIMSMIRKAEGHEQIAEWLEDYKRLKSIPEHTYENCHNITCRRICEKDGYDNGVKDGYSKAIDDFVKRCTGIHDGLITDWNKPYGITYKELKNIAEQLKGGA